MQGEMLDVAYTIRQLAEMAHVNPLTMKKRLLKRHEQEGGTLLIRFCPGGRLYCTLASARRVLGAEFGMRLPSPDDLEHMGETCRLVRRDLNASVARQREFQTRVVAWFQSLESKLGALATPPPADSGVFPIVASGVRC